MLINEPPVRHTAGMKPTTPREKSNMMDRVAASTRSFFARNVALVCKISAAK
jgi:hypothetical protein